MSHLSDTSTSRHVDSGQGGRVVVLAGGLSHERDVSLRSGSRVVDALVDAGWDASLRDADAGLVAALAADPTATVFPVLHGASGEDGAIRAVLELLGIHYVGSRPDACRLAFDKAIAKSVVAQAGLRTPEARALASATFRDLGAPALLDALVDRLGLPLVVKPNSGGSALGTSVVRAREELPTAMVGAYAYADVVLVEQFVAGTEVAVSVVDTGQGPIALPAVEIAPDGGIYDYEARYTAGRTEFFAPARLEPETAEMVAEAAVAAHRALGLRDLSRTDLMVDAAGVPWFLEVNVSPGMTETSLTPQAVRAGGLDLGQVCADLVQAAAGRGA
ncbi:MAG: D-alanine--D-alanine ligase [Sporichthyaceae bacterium]